MCVYIGPQHADVFVAMHVAFPQLCLAESKLIAVVQALKNGGLAGCQ